jgi:HAMP domain-containing protein
MPVRRGLALYGTSVAGAGMLLFIVLLSGLGANGVRDDQDRALTAMADAAAAALEGGGAPTTAFRPLVVIDLASSTEPFLLVLASDGTVRYASGLLNGAPPRIPAAVVVEANEQGRSVATVAAAGLAPKGDTESALRVVARRWKSESGSGIVVAGQSTGFPTSQLAGFRTFLVIAAIVTLIVVAIMSWLVAGRAVRPLVTLAKATEAIGATGDLSQRIALGRSRDEVGRLSTSFNAMLERLQSAQAELDDPDERGIPPRTTRCDGGRPRRGDRRRRERGGADEPARRWPAGPRARGRGSGGRAATRRPSRGRRRGGPPLSPTRTGA